MTLQAAGVAQRWVRNGKAWIACADRGIEPCMKPRWSRNQVVAVSRISTGAHVFLRRVISREASNIIYKNVI